MLTSLILAVAFQAAKEPPKAIDRSGEPALKQVIAYMKGLDNVHGAIVRSGRGDAVTPMYPDGKVEFWRHGASFRFDISFYWGDGLLIVTDGKAVLTDTQSEGAPVTITDFDKTLAKSCATLAINGDNFMPILYLLEGNDFMEKMAPKEAAVTSNANTIHIDSKALGQTTIYYHGKGVFDAIEYDNMPWQMEQHKKYPDWTDEPVPGSLTRSSLVIYGDKPGRRTFEVKAGKGREVSDNRKKKG